MNPIDTIAVYDIVFSDETYCDSRLGYNGEHMVFKRENPPAHNPQGHPAKYTAHFKYHAFSGSWIESHFSAGKPQYQVSTAHIISACDASSDERTFSKFEQLSWNISMTEEVQDTSCTFLDTLDDNGYPFMYFYMDFGYSGCSPNWLDCWAKRRDGTDQGVVSETVLSKAERGRLREMEEIGFPDSEEDSEDEGEATS